MVVRGPGDVALAEKTGALTRDVLSDVLGSTVAVAQGGVLSPESRAFGDFGDGSPTASWDTVTGYSGLPSTDGLTEYLARTFDNASRVWLQDDVYRGVVGDAPSLNRYAFVEGSPVTFTDVWGFFRSASDVDAFMAAHDPDRGKPLRAVLMDWAEDNPGSVTGMVTGFVFAAVCTAATAGVGLVACGVMGGAISSAIGSSIDYVDQTPASERNWGDYFQQVGVDTAVGAALGLAGEGLGVVLTGAAKPLLSSASRAATDVFVGGVASGADDAARVTLRSTWDDVAAGVRSQWSDSFTFRPRVTGDVPIGVPR